MLHDSGELMHDEAQRGFAATKLRGAGRAGAHEVGAGSTEQDSSSRFADGQFSRKELRAR